MRQSIVGGHDRKKKMKEKLGKGYPQKKGGVKEFKNVKRVELFALVFVGAEPGWTVCPAKSQENDGMKKGNDKQ